MPQPRYPAVIPTSRISPVQVGGLSGAGGIAAGIYQSLAVESDGTVWACGWNKYGQLGSGTILNRTTVGQVSGLSGVVGITASEHSNPEIKNPGVQSDGSCGANRNGHLRLVDGNSVCVIDPAHR